MKNTVKVIVSLLLVVGTLVCLAACGGEKKPSGVYELEKITSLSQEIGIDGEGMEDMRMRLEFLGDGKGVATSLNDDGEGDEDDKIEFKYDDKTIDMGGEILEYKLDGKTLTLTAEEGGETLEMIFKKK